MYRSKKKEEEEEETNRHCEDAQLYELRRVSSLEHSGTFVKVKIVRCASDFR